MLKYHFFFAEYSAKLVDLALDSGKIYEGEGFKYIKECFKNGTLHLIGLLSDGGVHSRLDQLQVGFIVGSLIYLFIFFYQFVRWLTFNLFFFLPICIFPVQLLLKGASERGAKRIRVHILTDGRDVLDGSSIGFLEILENDLAKLREKGVDAQIASGGGRMYVTMDRYEV
jgi:2,3-bisphosphoglycerate-independent phosphoglycerate mutase